METKLYIGNLSYQTTADELRSLFNQAGTVKEVVLMKERENGGASGFAFVTMNTQEEANQAIERFNGHSLGSRVLKVNLARPRESNYDSNQRGYRSNSQDRGGGQQY
jgi:cold-inducible RNA-binding protein